MSRVGKTARRLIIVSLGLTLSVSVQGKRKQGSTVGDLLQKVKKRSRSMSEKKNRTLVPKVVKQNFSNRQVDLSQVKPPSSSTFTVKRTTEEEKELLKVTDEGIDQLFHLTRRFKKSRKRGELWLRLAELYSEKARLIEYQIQNEYDEDLKDFIEKKRKGRPRLNLKPAHAYNKKGIQLYEWFIRDFPKDPKMDQALFYLGYNYFELFDERTGLKYYERLSKEYPKSKYVSESNFALGEFNFENEKWEPALRYYKKVAQNRRARLYSFALYKLAWCQYKVGKINQALKSLERVIKVGRRAKGKGDGSIGGMSRIRLAEESMKDLVIFYGEVGNADSAPGYFRKVSGVRSLNKMLERLGYYYLDTGSRVNAKKIFSRLISDNPYSPKAYDYQYQIVSMYGAAGNDLEFRKEVFHWINKYGPGSVWSKTNIKKRSLVKKANQLMESTLRNYVLQKHQTAQNSRTKNARNQAEKGYDIYFKTFKSAKKLPDMHFFYAELLFDMAKFDQAARHYMWLQKNAPNHAYAEKSIFNAILALDKGLPTEAEMKKIVGKSKSPVAFDSTIKSFISVSEKFLTKFPNAKNRTSIIFRNGNLHYYYNHFDHAILNFNKVIESDPKSKYAQWSASSILNIHEVRKDYKRLIVEANKLLEIPQMAKGAMGARIRKIRQNAMFIQAKNLESGDGLSKSAEAFEKISKKNAGTAIGLKAAFNAAINYAKSGNNLKALNLYRQIFASRKAEPDKKQAALRFMAEISAQLGRYKKAAEYYESYATTYPKDKLSTQFLFNAALIREGVLHYTKAISNYEAYFKKSRSKEKFLVLYRMGRIWERRRAKGHFDKALSYYKRYFNGPVDNKALLVETAFRIGRIYEWLKNKSKAHFWYSRVVAVQRNFAKKGSPVGASYAAEAKFKLVYKTYQNFRAIKIGLRNTQRSIKAKIGAKGRLEKELANVIRYDDGGMVVAALALQGQAEQHLAASLIKAPIPKGLSREDRKKYIEQVAQIAKPFSEKAIAIYQDAIKKGIKLKGYNDWLLVAMKELNKLDPKKYPLGRERVFPTRMVDWMGL